MSDEFCQDWSQSRFFCIYDFFLNEEEKEKEKIVFELEKSKIGGL